MKRIGILGGTFNPIHIGHLAMAQVACEKLGLDKVIFVPSNLPPNKIGHTLIEAHHRFKMVRLAVKGNSCFEVSDFEIKRGGKSFSIDTVKFFRDRFPKRTQLFFIIGEDNLSGLHTWKHVDEILQMVSFVVVNRPLNKKLKAKVKVIFITMPGLDISASYLRKCIVAGKTTKYLIPDHVLQYIGKQKLYQ